MNDKILLLLYCVNLIFVTWYLFDSSVLQQRRWNKLHDDFINKTDKILKDCIESYLKSRGIR